MMKVALVHDFLIEYGGAERVLEALHEIWPKAPVYTAFYIPDSLGWHAKIFKNWKIISSWGTKLPFWQHLVSPYRIFAKSFFEGFDLSAFNLVISSSAMYMAKAVKVPNGIHICYCHTPPRHLYGYHTASDWEKNFFSRISGHVINHFMRVWDFEAAQRVDYFIANSREVQSRIKKFYRRDSTVIYPPVDVNRFSLFAIGYSKGKRQKAKGDYFLVVSRLVAAKKVDVAVEVCSKLGLPLKVVGTGKEMKRLSQLAIRHSRKSNGQSRIANSETVEFLGEISDSQLITLYQNCRAVIFPAEQEDFGLVPVEAMAAGKPVITCAQGGVVESVIDWPAGHGKSTGVYFDPPTAGSLTLAINNFVSLEKRGYFDPKFIRNHALKFSKERFKRGILKFVRSKVKKLHISTNTSA